MSILKSIFTAIRGGASEVGESIVDSQAMRILEQEIRDSKDGIAKAKQSLAKLKAREVGCSRQLKDLQDEEAEYTGKLKQCMAADKAELATACAEKIGELRGDIAEKQSQVDQLSGETSKLYKIIEQRQKNIEKNEGEVEKLQTVMELSKTRSAMASAMPTNDSSAKRVRTAMERVQKKAGQQEDGMAADQWMADMESGADLDKQLAEAGIGSKSKNSAADIMAEFAKDK
jgi:phage shock protein A